MVSLMKAKWQGRPPFSIISYCATVDELYCNEDSGAEWRAVRRGSRAWRHRDKKIVELMHAQYGTSDGSLPHSTADLDPSAM